MESLQQQVVVLSHKVDELYQMLEQVNSKMSQCLAERSFQSCSGIEAHESIKPEGRYAYATQAPIELYLEHKDVLVEKNYLESSYQGSESELSPEIQIRRLTAQLTAAYNRIAALEEQLLSKRIHG